MRQMLNRQDGKTLRFDWMWLCRMCNQLKPLTDFQKDRNRKNGHHGSCKSCTNARRALWTRNNPEKQKAHKVAWAKRNVARMAEYRKRWIKDRGPEYCRQKTARWRRNNPEKNAALQAARYAGTLRATPRWANKEAIDAIYRMAVEVTKETGIKHTVDHVVPLKSKLVCGLHWEGNLRVITRSENSSKGNHRWPDMP